MSFRHELIIALCKYGVVRANRNDIFRLLLLVIGFLGSVVIACRLQNVITAHQFTGWGVLDTSMPIFERECKNVSSENVPTWFLGGGGNGYRFNDGIQYATAKHIGVNQCIMCVREADAFQCVVNSEIMLYGKVEERAVQMPATCRDPTVNVTLAARIELIYNTITSTGDIGPQKTKAVTGGLATTVQIMYALLHGKIKCNNWVSTNSSAWILPTSGA